MPEGEAKCSGRTLLVKPLTNHSEYDMTLITTFGTYCENGGAMNGLRSCLLAWFSMPIRDAEPSGSTVIQVFA